MDENQNLEVVFGELKERIIKGICYSFYCKRKLKPLAEAISDDLIQQGKQSVVTNDGGEYVVWWAV